MTTLKSLLFATTILTAFGAAAAQATAQSDGRIILAQQAVPEPEKKPQGAPAKPAPAKPAPPPAGRAAPPQQPRTAPSAPARPAPPAPAKPAAPPPSTRQAPPPAAQPRRPDQPTPPSVRQPQTQQQPSIQRREPGPRPNGQTPPPSRAPQPAPSATTPAPSTTPPPQGTPERRNGATPGTPAPRIEQRSPGTAPVPPATAPAAPERQGAPDRRDGTTPGTPGPRIEQRSPATTPAPPTAAPVAPEQRGAPAPSTTTPAAPSRQPSAAAQPRRIEELRQERREERRGNQTVIVEGDRTIIRQGDRTIIRRDEADRFRGRNWRDVRMERRGNENFTIAERGGGVQIVTVTDADGRLVRRFRRDRGGREVIIIDNRPRGPRYGDGYFVALPPPVIRIPRERYIVEADHADPAMIYDTLVAPPVDYVERGYTLDEIRYSAPLRDRMPRVDVDTITFDTGSWDVTADQADRLAPIAEAIRRAIERNPNEVFLIEGHTDAVGADIDNLSLSDRRAESVANLLSEHFSIPAENLTTQGYGEQQLKIPTEGPERQNRRVSVRRITPLLTGQNQVGGPPPR